MQVAYDILLSLTITHPYYLVKDPEAPDGYQEAFTEFELVPDNKTKALIQQFRLVTKKINNTWYLFFQTRGPFATGADSFVNKELLFELKINDTTFFSVTGENYLHGTDDMLWFNSPIDGVMVPQKREVRPLKFSYTINKVVRPVTLKVSTADGREIMNETITDADVKDMEIDLSTEGQHIYDISEVEPPPVEYKKIFAKEEIRLDFFYGIVYFKVLPTGDAELANHFTINVESFT